MPMVEYLLPITEISGSNLVITKCYLLSTCVEKTIIKRKEDEKCPIKTTQKVH